MSFYDPSVLDTALDAHIEEMRGLVKLVDEAMPNGVDATTPERLAAMRGGEAESGTGPFAAESVEGAEDRIIPGPGGDLRLHIMRPPEIEAVYLHIHGGGWALGTPEMNDGTNWQLAQVANVAIVSVDYRLAPEDPYPAGPDDCEAAALWLLENAEREFGNSRLLIGGESAGAHLSAATLLRMRDRHGAISRFLGANLVFGCYDMSRTPSQRDLRHTSVLSHDDVSAMPNFFLPEHGPEERRAPDVSPLYADLEGLTPALFTCGTADRLLDDTLFMAARWQAAGNRSELALYPEAPHGFTMFPIAMARAANERVERFVSGIVAGAAS